MPALSDERKRREIAAAERSLGPAILSQIFEIATDELVLYANNARTHSDDQIQTIAESIKTYGWMNPPLVDENNVVVAGHGRVAAAKRLGLTHIPVIRATGLTRNQIRAYRLADNRIAEIAGWDQEILAIELQDIVIESGFSVDALGWQQPEIDIIFEFAAAAKVKDDRVDELPPEPANAVSRAGDLWLCGDHRVLCGSAIDAAALARLMGGKKAQLVCQDPPWNIAVSSIGGAGRVKHREFVMASGEMSDDQFRDFLRADIRNNADHAVDGAVIEVFIDWRSVEKVITAGASEGLELINILVWVKSNGGMSGGPWRSRHELVVVFRKPGAKIKNRVELGKFGRYRTNVLEVAGLNSFGKDRMEALESHPTRKPVELIADLIRDVTDIGDIVLDTFLGSGTCLIAAERTRRICYGMELDPLYVDTVVRRWEHFTDKAAVHEAGGMTFADVAAQPAAGELAQPKLATVRTRARRAAQVEGR